MLRVFTICVLSLLTVALVATAAGAQTTTTPVPFAGLFGGARQQTQSLVLGGSLFGVYQETLLPPDQEAQVHELDPRFQKTGAFGGASGTYTYSYARSSDNSTFSLGSRGTASTYTVSPDVVQLGFGLNTGLTTKLTRKIDFRSSASSSYSPFYGFDPASIAGADNFSLTTGTTALVTPESQFGAATIDNINANASIGITASITKRSSIYSDLSWNRVYFLSAGANDFWGFSGRVGLSHRLTRTLGFHAGYTQSVSEYAGSTVGPSRTQGPDVGLDFGDAGSFALTRRTTVSFGASATSAYSGYNGGATHYALTGNANIKYSISRTWSAVAAYARNFGFSALFQQAILTDSVNGSLGGRLAPRTTWSSGAGWTHGEVGFDSSSSYKAYSATSSVQVGLARALSAYAQYGYNRYTVPPGTTTLSILSAFSRQTFSVGLTTSVPIINSVRSHS